MLDENNSESTSSDQRQPADDQDIWQVIANAGIKIRLDYVDPSRGWVASVQGRRLGPFATREEALSAAIRSLVDRLQQADSRLEHIKRRGWYWFDAFFD